MDITRWIHLMGMIVFVGGGLCAAIVNRLSFIPNADSKTLDAVQWHLSRFANVGAIFLLGSGIGGLLLQNYTFSILLYQTWLLLMIGFGTIAIVCNYIAVRKVRWLLEVSKSVVEENPIHQKVRTQIAWLRIGFLLSAIIAVTFGVWHLTF